MTKFVAGFLISLIVIFCIVFSFAVVNYVTVGIMLVPIAIVLIIADVVLSGFGIYFISNEYIGE